MDLKSPDTMFRAHAPVQLEISSKVFALKSRVFALLGAKALEFGAKTFGNPPKSRVFAPKSRVIALLGAKSLDFGAKALDLGSKFHRISKGF